MGVNSLPKTVTRQRRDCDLNPGPSAPESSTLTTRLPSHHIEIRQSKDSFLIHFTSIVSLHYPAKPLAEKHKSCIFSLNKIQPVAA